MNLKNKILLFAGSAHPELAKKVAKILKMKLGKISIARFADGEIDIWLQEKVFTKDVFIIQPTNLPVNENILELCLIADSLRRSGAHSITGIVPYFGYSRKDKQFRFGEPISSKVIIDILVASGLDRIVAFDLHNRSLVGFTHMPFFELSALKIFAQKIKQEKLLNLQIFSPDTGGLKRARDFARILNLPLGFIEKQRNLSKRDQSEILTLTGDVKNKNIILLDDIISTGGTLINAAQYLKKLGAKKVYACATHALFDLESAQKLQDSEINKLFVTNTIAIPENLKFPKLRILPIESEIVKYIKNIYN